MAKEPEDRPHMAAVALELQRLAQPGGDGSAMMGSPAPRPAPRDTPFADTAPGLREIVALPDEKGGSAAAGIIAAAPSPQPPPDQPPAAEVSSVPTGAPASDGSRSPRRSPGPNGWTPGGSGAVWEPMEIIKTDYQSTPGMDLKVETKRKARLAVYPPGLWIMLAYALLALVATIVRRGFLH